MQPDPDQRTPLNRPNPQKFHQPMQGLELSELFAQQVHISRLQSILKEHTSPEKQLLLLEQLHKSEASPTYQCKVLDHVTRHINNSTYEMHEDMLESHAQAQVAKMQEPAGATAVIYRFNEHKVVIEEERDTLAKFGGTGFRTWEAALALSDYLIENPLKEKNILELGAGTGHVSHVLQKLNYHVLSTDGDDSRLVGLNHQTLWWDTFETAEIQALKRSLQPETVIVAADVLYDPQNYAPFLFTTSKLLENARYALVATTMRNPETYALLEPECKRVGLEVRHIKTYCTETGRYSKYFYLNDSRIEIIKLTLSSATQ